MILLLIEMACMRPSQKMYERAVIKVSIPTINGQGTMGKLSLRLYIIYIAIHLLQTREDGV